MSYSRYEKALGVTKETTEEFGVSGQPTGLPPHLPVDLPHRVGGEVGQPANLEIGPELLDRVEFGRIGGQPLHMPLGMNAQIGVTSRWRGGVARSQRSPKGPR